MRLSTVLIGSLALSGLTALPGPAIAQQARPQASAPATPDRFAPRASGDDTRLDWRAWDGALSWFVLNMGPSLRELPPRREPAMGTRFVFGHDSRYRLEGNRIAFQFLEDKQRAALTEYRVDLERIGTELDIASLPRNEQLAFWTNLHNVAVIEQLALAYPVMSPDKVSIDGVPLDQAKFITVAGVALSPQDIRTRIVFPHWDDPRVIYGFFRGAIGGPSISRRAYTGRDIARQLVGNAREFVNALRGVDRNGNTLRVSRIYAEARPFYFPDWERDLRAHLANYAEGEVAQLVAAGGPVEASIYETDIADLSKGEREPAYSQTDECATDPTTRNVGFPDRTNGGQCPVRIDIPIAIQRFEVERREKIARLVERGLIGTVVIRELRDEEPGTEVE